MFDEMQPVVAADTARIPTGAASRNDIGEIDELVLNSACHS